MMRSNAAVDNADGPFLLAATAGQSRNSWQEEGWSAATFRSTDPAGATGPRRPDGTLPATAFLAGGNGVGASMGN
jgi:hypothetical protein